MAFSGDEWKHPAACSQAHSTDSVLQYKKYLEDAITSAIVSSQQNEEANQLWNIFEKQVEHHSQGPDI